MDVDSARMPYPMTPQTMPPMIVAHRTLRIPRLRRYPVPIWTKDSNSTKNENEGYSGMQDVM
jgi:hypothetical protein